MEFKSDHTYFIMNMTFALGIMVIFGRIQDVIAKDCNLATISSKLSLFDIGIFLLLAI